MKEKECVHCGECCRKVPCVFGDCIPCIHLTQDNMCGIHDKIIQDPSSWISPAFGTGCCRTLFNPIRDKILLEGGD